MTIEELAARHHGMATWTFKQGAMAVWMKYREFAWKGICASLSAHWIKYHAQEGSLASVLGGANLGDLNEAKLRQIGLLHELATDTRQQEETLMLWLRMQGIIPMGSSFAYPRRGVKEKMPNLRRTNATYQARARDMREIATGTNIDVASGVVDSLKKTVGKSFYAYITFGGTVMKYWEAGHAVCAYIGGPSGGSRLSWSDGDAVFFDPNHGEFWFKHKADFFEFFKAFYPQTYVSGTMKFNRRWSVQPLGLAMRFAR